MKVCVPIRSRQGAEVRELNGLPYAVPEAFLLGAGDHHGARVHIQSQTRLPDQPRREGVDGRYPGLAETAQYRFFPFVIVGHLKQQFTNPLFDPAPHLAGGRFGVGQGQDVPRQKFLRRKQQARIAVREHPGLARPRSRPDGNEPSPGGHSAALALRRSLIEAQGVALPPPLRQKDLRVLGHKRGTSPLRRVYLPRTTRPECPPSGRGSKFHRQIPVPPPH